MKNRMIIMKNRDESLKPEMLDKIMSGGAWFSTGKNKYLKIGYSETDDCLIARECTVTDEGSLEGGAYTFGTDWFDICFHGRYIDIYVDPKTFRRWDVWYDPEKGTRFKAPEDRIKKAERIAKFCRQADGEALAGGIEPYMITGADFSNVIELSE